MIHIIAPLLFIFVTLFSCQQERELSPKNQQIVTGNIVGGIEAKNHEFASVALIDGSCTGNLVTKNTVLSAAHCILPYNLNDDERAQLRSLFYSQIDDQMQGNDIPLIPLINDDDEARLKELISKAMRDAGTKLNISFSNGIEVRPLEVEVHHSYISWIYTFLFSPADQKPLFSSIFDLVKITLPYDIETITPIPLASSEELTAIDTDNTFIAVGYGRALDLELRENLSQKALRDEDYLIMNSHKEHTDEYKAIRQRYKKIKSTLAQTERYVHEPPMKRYVSIKYRRRASRSNLVFEALTCHGDSGGPIFLLSGDGNLKQIGIISGGTHFCGIGDNIIIPVSTSLLESDL